MVLLYLFKYLFGMEVPFKSYLEYLRSREYQGKDFTTLFIKTVKPALDTKDADRKRVIFLFNSFVSISGGDIRFIEVFKRVKDFDKVIITPFIGRKICEMKKLNATYFLTTNEEHFENIFFAYFRRIINALFLKIEIWNEDILYSTSDFLPDVLPAFVYKLKNKNVKWVQIIHHLIPLQREGPRINNLISFYAQRISFFFIKRYSDLIIVVNPLVKKKLKEIGFNSNKIKVNSNGVDLNYFENIEPNKEIMYDGIFLGRLHLSKGIFDLLKIWKIVYKEKTNARLGIIGSGSKRIEDELTKRIRESNLKDKIKFLGHLNDDETFSLLKSSRVFVFPSHEEGFGISMLEAMACELPVVAYDLAAYRVFGDALIKVPLRDKRNFAEALLRLLSDEQIRKELSGKARKMASQFDWDLVAKRELSLLEELVEGQSNVKARR